MGTFNKMMLREAIDKYKKSGQIEVKNGKLTVLEKDKEKQDEIMWELSSYSPQLTLQMFKS